MTRRPVTLSDIRGYLWARRALRSAARQLDGWRGAVDLPGPPRVPLAATRGVEAAIRRTNATCFERALVRQRWLAGHGRRHDVVVGVTGPGHFSAHAWLDGVEAGPPAFRELHRLPAGGD